MEAVAEENRAQVPPVMPLAKSPFSSSADAQELNDVKNDNIADENQ